MLQVVCKIRPSVHSAYPHSGITASVVAVYDKLKNLELTTAQGLVRHIAGEAETIITHIAGMNPPLLAGYRVKFLDGNCFEATDHRLKILRGTRAGALPGKSLSSLIQPWGLPWMYFPVKMVMRRNGPYYRRWRTRFKRRISGSWIEIFVF